MNTVNMDIKFNMRISKTLMFALKKKAKKEGRNYSEIVRQLIMEYTKEK